MPSEAVANNEIGEPQKQTIENKTPLDYLAVALATWGVGFIPVAPGTWGSAVGVGIYLFVRQFEILSRADIAAYKRTVEQITAWNYAVNACALLIFCSIGIWAASRAAKIFDDKDPQTVVVDEVIGQLIVFLFVPFDISWKLIFAGFLLFRLFDIWKPYPIDSLQNLSGGIGVCADDILAGVYGGVCLAVIYAISLSV